MFFFGKKYSTTGFSLVEFVLVLAIIPIIFTILIIYLKPDESKQKARDSRRLQDMQTLQRAIIEFSQDTGTLPDLINVLRKSNELPGGSLDLYSSSGGWISQNLSGYIVYYPVDPVNDDVYFYSYTRNDTSFELNARLETLSEFSQDDGGNDSTVYEVGTNLLLIEP